MALTPWRDRYLVFGAPDIRREEYDEVLACLDSRWIGTGPRVTPAGGGVSRLHRCAGGGGGQLRHRPRCSSPLKVLAFEPGSEIITSTMTFCATANAIVHAGCVPGPRRLRPRDDEPRRRRRARGGSPQRTRAILPVHFAGRPCDMPAIMALARAHDLAVDRGLRARDRGDHRRPALRHVRRLRLLQLLRHQEHDHRRGRHGHLPRPAARRSHRRAGAARHDQGRPLSLPRRRLRALRRPRARLQAQSDRSGGVARPASARPHRGELGAPARAVGLLPRGTARPAA